MCLYKKTLYFISFLRSITQLNQHTGRDLTVIIPTIGSIILNLRNRSCNKLQIAFGLFLFSHGAPRKVIEVLCLAGLSVSPWTIDRALESLGKDSAGQVRRNIGMEFCFLVYDNINFATQKCDQRSNNVDSFESGTTATMVVGEDPGNQNQRTYAETYGKLKADDLMSDTENAKHLDFVLHCRVQTFE
ncbi:hypothetical protein BX616_003252, partial [Lobosporangium transversale]